MNRFVADNNYKRNEDYLSIFNSFSFLINSWDSRVYTCRVDIYFTIKKVVNCQTLIIRYLRHNKCLLNVKPSATEGNVACCQTYVSLKYYRRKQIMSGTRQELWSLRLIDERCELFIYKWVTEMCMPSEKLCFVK